MKIQYQLITCVLLAYCSTTIAKDNAQSQLNWQQGETIWHGACFLPEQSPACYTVYLSENADQLVVIQDFHSSGKKLTDPYTVINNQVAQQDVPQRYNYMDGRYLAWYENGQKALDYTFEKGKKQGAWIAWYQSGQKYFERHFKDDLEHGTDIEWYPNGQQKYLRTYENDKKHGLWGMWYENGKPEHQGYYQNNYQHGLIQGWHVNGRKQYEGYYKEGLKQGVWTSWYDNGQKESEGKYLNHRQVGTWTYWEPQGNIIQKINYDSE